VKEEALHEKGGKRGAFTSQPVNDEPPSSSGSSHVNSHSPTSNNLTIKFFGLLGQSSTSISTISLILSKIIFQCNFI
jgi:hypothetical protein